MRPKAADAGREAASGNATPPKEDWLCKACVGGSGLPFRNSGSKAVCGKCQQPKGSCFGEKAKPRKRTEEPRRPRAPRAEDIVAKKALAEKRELERQIATLQKQNKQLAQAQAGPVGSAKAAQPYQPSAAMEVEPADSNCAALDAAIDEARRMLEQVKGLSEDLRGLVAGGYSECLARYQAALSGAQAARRAANPIKKQLESAEQASAREAKKLADARAQLLRRQTERQALDMQIVLDEAAVAAAETASAKLAAEVSALAELFAQERTAGPQASTPPAACASEETEEKVSVAFAQQKWAEREAAFEQQLAEVRALVSAQTDAQSEAGEVEPMEQLEDDEAWSKVDKGKRQKLLRRERVALATSVRTSLGKVSTVSSPFKKT